MSVYRWPPAKGARDNGSQANLSVRKRRRPPRTSPLPRRWPLGGSNGATRNQAQRTSSGRWRTARCAF
eukprot:6877350-Pyramimonas_sp.AAC.1